MKNYRIAALLAAAAFMAACTTSARIDCTIDGAAKDSINIRQLNVNTFSVLDTVVTRADGSFSYKVPVQKGQPEFVYIFRGETSLASLLLKAGDRVKVKTDTLANCTVKGSEESELLMQNERRYAKFLAELNNDNATALELGKLYVAHYRENVKYIMAHPYSLTVIPVLYEQLDARNTVMSQLTDAIHFRAAADSLKKVYPDSKYVKALEKEAERRESLLGLETKLRQASTMAYPEISLPGIKGTKMSLSEVPAKLKMVHFWSASDATHKMFNLDVLMPLWKKYHDRGFEIYSVCIDTDKALWAGVVDAQKLPWVNVCDGKGAYSPALLTYNVQQLPASFLVSEDGIANQSGTISQAGLDAAISKLLK